MTINKITAIALAGLLTAGFAAPIVAQEMLMGSAAVEKRVELMKSNGGTLRGAGAATGDDAVAAAQTMVDNFAALADLWPEDSQDNTRALPAVWENPDDFAMKLGDASAAAAAMLIAAQSGDADAYGASIKELGASCGSCHQAFQAPR